MNKKQLSEEMFKIICRLIRQYEELTKRDFIKDYSKGGDIMIDNVLTKNEDLNLKDREQMKGNINPDSKMIGGVKW